MDTSKENGSISLSKLHLGKTKSVLEQSCWPTGTSERRDSLDSHETPALSHIATPAAVRDHVKSLTYEKGKSMGGTYDEEKMEVEISILYLCHGFDFQSGIITEQYKLSIILLCSI